MSGLFFGITASALGEEEEGPRGESAGFSVRNSARNFGLYFGPNFDPDFDSGLQRAKMVDVIMAIMAIIGLE